MLSSEQELSSTKLLVVGLLLYSFFWVIPRRLNSDAGESPKEIIQYSQHVESLTSRSWFITWLIGHKKSIITV